MLETCKYHSHGASTDWAADPTSHWASAALEWGSKLKSSAEIEHMAINHERYIAKFIISPDYPMSVNIRAVWSHSLKNLFSMDDTLGFIIWNYCSWSTLCLLMDWAYLEAEIKYFSCFAVYQWHLRRNIYLVCLVNTHSTCNRKISLLSEPCLFPAGFSTVQNQQHFVVLNIHRM